MRHCKNLAEYDWLILTSVNGVDALWERLRKLHIGGKTMHHLKVAAIGPATRQAIERHGVKVNVVPKEYVAESVVASLRRKVKGKRVLAGAGQGRARCDSAGVAQTWGAGGCGGGLRDRDSTSFAAAAYGRR